MVRSIAHVLRLKEINHNQPRDGVAASRPHIVSTLPRRGGGGGLPPEQIEGDGSGAAAFFSRFVVLQAIGVAGFVGLWVAGLAEKPFESGAAPMCYIILCIGALGMLCVALRRWRDAQWIATHVVRIGLLGTVIGLIIAFSHAVTGDAGNPADIKPMIAAVVGGMYVSLYATLFGIGTNLWLKINLRLLGNQHG